MKRKLLFFAVILAVAAVNPIRAAGETGEKEELSPVLLVMDVQNLWLPMMDKEDRDTAPAKINELIAVFRDSGHPVIRVYHSEPGYGPEPGTEQFEYPETVDIRDDDIMIVKNYGSAFQKTDLEDILRKNGNNAVFLCGLSATGCVLATYYGSLEREFLTVMVEGTLLSQKAEYTKVIEKITRSATIEKVRETLSQ